MFKANCTGIVQYQGGVRGTRCASRRGSKRRRVQRFGRRVAASVVVVFGLSLPVISDASDTDLHLVASPNVNLENLSKKDVSAIFLGSRRHWSDGSRIRIAILDAKESQRPFLQAVVDRSPPQYWAHWRNIVFSGRGIMPRIFKSDEELIGYLSEQEGVIGQVRDISQLNLQGAVSMPFSEVQAP